MSFDTEPIPRYMSVHEVADLLHVTVHTIYNYLKLPDPLPSHQIVPRGKRLFIEPEVRAWVTRFRCIDTAAGEVA